MGLLALWICLFTLKVNQQCPTIYVYNNYVSQLEMVSDDLFTVEYSLGLII